MDIKSIVSQMTLEEKAKMCSGKDFWHIKEVERLGVPSVMVSDGPYGLRKQAESADHLGLNASVKAINFPTGSCIANSFDRDLLKASGETLAEECQAEEVAVLLGPAVNIKRSPLCGRNFEYFSEDPYLTGELAEAYINGVQSKNIGTSIKHFAANSQEHRRMTGDSIVDERTLREIYLPGFEKAVKESQPWSVMCSYNKLNGTFASENRALLTDILRGEWGFEGFVVSDWGAVNDRPKGLYAGLDLEMPGDSAVNDNKIIAAVKSGELSEAVLDTAVERIINIIMKYTENKYDVKFDHERDHERSKNAARESMVLLKNENKLLPLAKSKNAAFIGAFAESPRFQGGGSSHVNSYKVTSSVDYAKTQGISVTYAQGFTIEKEYDAELHEKLLAEAVRSARAADAAVLFIGLPDHIESEGYDRKDMKLPKRQQRVIEEVAKVQKNVAVVVESGSPIEMPWTDVVDGVLYAYLGGEAAGEAVVDLLYGDANPCGKLAESFPIKLEDNPSYLYYLGEGDRVEYNEGIFVGYRYYDKKKMEVKYPFGHGLSYASFQYSGLTLDKKKMKDTGLLKVSVKVKNVGTVAGKEIVQLYVADNESTVIKAEKELKGFEKVELAPGEEKTVDFTLCKRAFAYYNTEINNWYVESGDYTVLIGKSSRDIVLEETVNVESTVAIRKKYHLNSTLGDISRVPAGQKLMRKVSKAFAGTETVEETEVDFGSVDMMVSMLKDMPLRSCITLGGGAVTEAEIIAMLEEINV